MATSGRHWEQDKEATVYVGNLDERVTDAIVWELMLQAGRIVNVHLPKDRVSQTHQGYGFVEFTSEEDADYAARIMNQVRLYGKPIRVNKASADKQKTTEVGAELFVGNLNQFVDEKVLWETFSRFGNLVSPPKITREETGISKGYGFVSFGDFDASDAAIENMHGAYLYNQEISVQYAFKKDGKGERHGDEAERRLAMQAKANNVQPTVTPMPPQFFPQPSIGGPSAAPSGPPLSIMNGTGGPHAIVGAQSNFGPSNGYVNGMMPSRPSSTPGPSHLSAPPPGLPQRPPPPQAGFGPPQASMAPPGFRSMPGYPPQQSPPPGFGITPGFAPPPGYPPPPPQMPPQYGRR